MLIDSDAPSAVPLWINGHAFLTMPSEFQNVCSRTDGRVLRRTPLCSAEVAVKAVDAALNASEGWSALSRLERSKLFLGLAEAMLRYVDHFRSLIVEEAGKTEVESSAEVDAALAVLIASFSPPESDSEHVVAVIGEASAPLLGPLRVAIPALLAGSAVIAKPDPATPSVLVALAELMGRCGFPPGVFNVVHGGEAVLAGLRESRGVRLLFV
jgi:succinate-semialdehyde dehydrogenase / glutarate-semialdehyde dehydrogenase